MIGEYIYVMKMRKMRLTTDVTPGASLSGVRRNTALAVPTRRLEKQKQLVIIEHIFTKNNKPKLDMVGGQKITY